MSVKDSHCCDLRLYKECSTALFKSLRILVLAQVGRGLGSESGTVRSVEYHFTFYTDVELVSKTGKQNDTPLFLFLSYLLTCMRN